MLHYLICSTPRVGSNLLCALLFATRAVGHPREYFCPLQVAEFGRELIGKQRLANAADLHRFLDAAAVKYGTDGTFGIKAHLSQLRAALEAGYDLDGRFPDRFVHITRADVLGQAISLVRAAQTGAWTARSGEVRTPQYSDEAIRDAVRSIVAENQAWEAVFRTYDVEPYRLSYERLCANFEGELTALLRYLDVDLERVDVPAAVAAATGHFKQQRDDTSADWRARYNGWLRARATVQRDRMAAARDQRMAAAAI